MVKAPWTAAVMARGNLLAELARAESVIPDRQIAAAEARLAAAKPDGKAES